MKRTGTKWALMALAVLLVSYAIHSWDTRVEAPERLPTISGGRLDNPDGSVRSESPPDTVPEGMSVPEPITNPAAGRRAAGRPVVEHDVDPRIVSDPKALAAIADPLEAMLTPTSADDLAWLQEHGWPAVDEVTRPLDPDDACVTGGSDTLAETGRCAVALWRRNQGDDEKSLASMAVQGSALAARLRILLELSKPRGMRDQATLREMVVVGLLTGDSWARQVVPGATSFQFFSYEIASVQGFIGRDHARLQMLGLPIPSYRPRPFLIVPVSLQNPRAPMIPVPPGGG